MLSRILTNSHCHISSPSLFVYLRHIFQRSLLSSHWPLAVTKSVCLNMKIQVLDTGRECSLSFGTLSSWHMFYISVSLWKLLVSVGEKKNIVAFPCKMSAELGCGLLLQLLEILLLLIDVWVGCDLLHLAHSYLFL